MAQPPRKWHSAPRNRSLLGSALVLTLSLGLAFSSLSYAATLTRTSAFDYDATTGLLTKEIIEPDTPNLCLVTTYSYDGFGNKNISTTRNCGVSGDPTGVVTTGEATTPTGDAAFPMRTSRSTYTSGSTSVSGTTYTWAAGQFATSSSNALSQSESREFDPRFGTPTKLTGPNSLATQWGYDSFGRKIAEKRADGTGTIWSYQYCSGVNGGSATCPTNIGGIAAAYVVTSTPVVGPINLTVTPVTTGAPNGPASKTYYDALNREIRAETQGYDGSGSGIAIYKDTQYDSLGRPYMTSRPYYTGQTVYWATTNYDSIGRVSSQVLPADGSSTSTTTSYAYNGLVTTVTNANNQARVTTKNSQGQVVTVTDAASKTLTYYYDQFGNLIETKDTANNLTYLTYDLRGRKTQMIDRDMGSWSYVYDALGQLVKQTNAKAQLTIMSYDLLGRMTQRAEADLISKWYYDNYKGGGACNKGIGKLCQAETDHGYNKTIAYDNQGRYLSASTSVDTTYSESVSYDTTTGRLATQTYPTGFILQYVYTSLGYLRQVKDSSNNVYWTANSLDAEGHLLQQTYGNGVQTIQNYNAANGRITSITAGAGNAVQYLAYAYDNLGNITTRQDVNQNVIESFLYDTLNRLTIAQINGGPLTFYGYNDIGNITSRSDLGTYTYNASGATSVRPHAVTRVDFSGGGYRSYVYDGNGNLSGQTEYDSGNNPIANKSRIDFYTSFNMPTSLGSPLDREDFSYGPEHQRVRKISSNRGTTIYLNPGNSGELSYEKDTHADSSSEERHFITAGGAVVAVVKKSVAGGVTTWTTHYLHRDNLGSTTAVTNSSGTVIERLAYESFGKRRFPSGQNDPANSIVGVNTVRGYTNHEMLDELGLVHMNGRIYDPTIGRFLSADPVIPSPGDLQSYNRYSYVLNNPLLYTDPSGFRTHHNNFFSQLWHNPEVRAAAAIAAAIFAPEISGYLKWTGGSIATAAGTVTIDGGLSYAIGISSSTVASGMLGGAMAGGILGGDLRSAIIGGLTGGAFGAVGDMWPSGLGNVAGHAAVGCASASLSGGGCGPGSLSAAAGAGWSNYGPESLQANFIAVTVVGGTASVLGGGKFGNGAMTAAFGYLFNCALHDCWDKYLLNGSKAMLGAAGVLGGASLCATGVGCAMGAPSVAFSASTVAEGINGIIGLATDTSDGKGQNILVDGIKSGLQYTPLSPAQQNLAVTGLQVTSDIMALRAPVTIAERWIIAPSASTLPGLAIKSTAWATGSKAAAGANLAVDAFGF